MHATYSYLIDTLEEAENDEQRADVARSAVENYLNRHGDENNWSNNLLLICHDGTLIPLHEEIAKELARETDHWLASKPAEERFDIVKRFALSSTANDMHLRDANSFMGKNEEAKKLDLLSYDELAQAISTEIPATLTLLYADLTNPEPRKDSSQADYERRKLVRRYEAFRDSTVAPFTEITVTPYDYRCVDLRENTQGELADITCGIVLVDVHT